MSEDDYDYECQDCGHRFTVPFDQFYPPDECPECGSTWGFLTKETVEENERINARES